MSKFSPGQKVRWHDADEPDPHRFPYEEVIIKEFKGIERTLHFGDIEIYIIISRLGELRVSNIELESES